MIQCGLDQTTCWKPTWDATSSEDSSASVSSKPLVVALNTHMMSFDPIVSQLGVSVACIQVTYVRVVQVASLLREGMESMLTLRSCTRASMCRTLFQQDFGGGAHLKRDQVLFLAGSSLELAGWWGSCDVPRFASWLHGLSVKQLTSWLNRTCAS